MSGSTSSALTSRWLARVELGRAEAELGEPRLHIQFGTTLQLDEEIEMRAFLGILRVLEGEALRRRVLQPEHALREGTRPVAIDHQRIEQVEAHRLRGGEVSEVAMQLRRASFDAVEFGPEARRQIGRASCRERGWILVGAA